MENSMRILVKLCFLISASTLSTCDKSRSSDDDLNKKSGELSGQTPNRNESPHEEFSTEIDLAKKLIIGEWDQTGYEYRHGWRKSFKREPYGEGTIEFRSDTLITPLPRMDLVQIERYRVDYSSDGGTASLPQIQVQNFVRDSSHWLTKY